MKLPDTPKTFIDYPWEINYRTSILKCDGEPINILHDFYLPVLARAIQYDRVGGFFNPYSLAAASQGMTAFRQPNCKARLIVQTQYAPQQIQAILDEYTVSGNQEQLSSLLNNELDEFESLHQNVQNGLHLISVMIKKEVLEIRLAFRINCRTGKAISFESCEDGYIHSNWGIFKDSADNRICITGALNISSDGLSLNAENIDVYCEWKNEENLKRIKNAEYEFELLWDDLNPYVRVLPLPNAVRERFFKIAEFRNQIREIDGSESIVLESPMPSAIERLKFALIKDGPKLPGGKFVGIETLPVPLLPHEEIAARTMIESWPYSYILSDDIGNSKIAEVGAIVRSLYLSGIVERVLIITPESLKDKWQRELVNRFFLPFAVSRCDSDRCHDYILPLEEQVKSISLFDPDLNIISINLVHHEVTENDLLSSDFFDIMIFDAAHQARRYNLTDGFRSAPRYNDLYIKITEDIAHKCRSVYLLVDKPEQFDLLHTHDLLKLTNRLGSFQHEPRLFQWFLDILEDIHRNRTISQIELNFIKKVVLKLQSTDPYFFNMINESILPSEHSTNLSNWLNNKIPPDANTNHSVCNMLYASSPLFRIFQKHRRSLLKKLRNTGYLNSKVTDRSFVQMVDVNVDELVAETSQQVDYYCKELKSRISDPSKESAIMEYTGFLWMRLYSSVYALRETLRQRLEKILQIRQNFDSAIKQSEIEYKHDDLDDIAEDNFQLVQSVFSTNIEDIEWEQLYLERMVERLADLSTILPKMRALFRTIFENRKIFSTGRYRQTVIVTRFYDTLMDIFARLRQAYPEMLIGACSERGGQYIDIRAGETINTSREEIRNLFLREEIDILVCTDAVIDTLSFQTTDMLINYDLPWHPELLERRIRKICQVGQKYDWVEIVNICYSESPEAYVYGKLVSEISQSDSFIKDRFPEMIPVKRREFIQLALGLVKKDELKIRVKERLGIIKSRMLYWKNSSTRYDELYFKQIQEIGPSGAPVTLSMIWETLYGSKYFQNIGCTILPFGNKQILSIKHIEGIQDGTIITASKDIYESGIKGISSKIYFATYGDPVFDILLNHIDAFGLPACIKRIEIAKSDATIPLVGYVVACINEFGESEKRLITSPLEVEGLVLDENAELTMEDVLPIYEMLEEISRKEYQKIYHMDTIIKTNITEGSSQKTFNYLLLQTLLKTYLSNNKNITHFDEFVKKVESDCIDKEIIQLPNLTYGYLSKLSNLYFDDSFNKEIVADIPVQLILASIDSGYRLMDDSEKESILIHDILARLDAELKSML